MDKTMQLKLREYRAIQVKSEELRERIKILSLYSNARSEAEQQLALSELAEEQLRERLGRDLGATLDSETRSWLGESLANDENTPDDDLRKYYSENGLKTEQIDVALALRQWFLNDLSAHL
jgi:hypothetical protein